MLNVDSLAHLNDPRMGSVQVVLDRAAAAGVMDVVSAGTDPCVDVEWQCTHPQVRIWRALGIHPRALRPGPEQLVALQKALDSTPNVVAVGEIGLDYRADMPAVEAQEEALIAQLDVAAQRGLPVILHCVYAIGRLLALLQKRGPVRAGGVLHGFTGPPQLLPQFAALGMYISFGGQVARPEAKRCRRAAKAVSQQRLLLESDCPDHPAPGWSDSSEPAMLPLVAQAVADIRGQEVAQVAAQAAANAHRLYNIPPLVTKLPLSEP